MNIINRFNNLYFCRFSPSTFPDLLHLLEVGTLAKKYKKTPAQILLHFLVKQNIVVIPKSTNLDRLRVSFEIY